MLKLDARDASFNLGSLAQFSDNPPAGIYIASRVRCMQPNNSGVTTLELEGSPLVVFCARRGLQAHPIAIAILSKMSSLG